MKPAELVALAWGEVVGRIRRTRAGGRLAFAYEARWRERADAIALSLSMPLAVREHGNEVIESYLWGLLPDNERILERWARRYHVSPGNAFSLIAEVGEDCAGAIQFAVPERADEIRGQGILQAKWLDEEDVAARLRALRGDQAAWRLADDRGQFSLAGAQPKTALLRLDGRWGIPFGRTATTHILKPPLGGLAGHAENEHLCLLLARHAGLATANSEVRRFGDEIAIVVERYDRIHATGTVAPRAQGESQPVLRVHQEDLCQALGVRPTLKYQNEGGPSPVRIVELLRAHSGNPGEDVRAFLDALTLNWLIGGTDAHAKNYSLLHAPGGRVRLAPLYDLASVLPYPDMDSPRVKLAMSIGGEYRLRRIHRGRWEALAEEWSLDRDRVVGRMIELSGAVLDAVPVVRGLARESGLDHPIVDRLLDLVSRRTTACLRDLEGPNARARREEE